MKMTLSGYKLRRMCLSRLQIIHSWWAINDIYIAWCTDRFCSEEFQNSLVKIMMLPVFLARVLVSNLPGWTSLVFPNDEQNNIRNRVCERWGHDVPHAEGTPLILQQLITQQVYFDLKLCFLTWDETVFHIFNLKVHYDLGGRRHQPNLSTIR